MKLQLYPLTAALFLIGAAEIIAGPMMVHMGSHFGVPSARIAWLQATYALAYCVAAPFFGPLSDRIGRKALLVPALFGIASGQLMVAATPYFGFALCGCCVVGCSAAIVLPNTLALVADNVPSHEQAAAAGRVFRGLTFSFITVPVIGAVVASRYDWRLAYCFTAVVALCTSRLVAKLQVVHRLAEPPENFRRSVCGAVQIHTIRARLAVSLLWLGLSIGNVTVLAEVLRRRFGLDVETVGVLVGAFGITTMLGNSFVPVLLRHFPARGIVVCGIVGTIGGCGMLGIAATQLDHIALLAGFSWAFAYGVAGPVHHASLGLAAPQASGTVYALQASLLNVGIVVVGFAAGRYFDSLGPEPVIGVTLVGMTLALLLLPRQY